jgi:hypothetical protein
MFATEQELLAHITRQHKTSNTQPSNDNVTPIIEAMPADLARKNRAVFSGPSRSLSIGQGRR